MKSITSLAVISAAAILASGVAKAAISGINNPLASYATIQFDDTASLQPLPGTTVAPLTTLSWAGSSWTYGLTTDPVTSDFAKGNLMATYAPLSYAVSLNSVLLNQAAGNTGSALLIFQFSIQYQIDSGGLPSLPTYYPNFVVNGTVQSASTSFAAVSGFIDYYAVNSAGTYGVVETVNYGQSWTTPGSFSGTVAGVPVYGSTPALTANTTLTLVGDIRFIVDPANISAETVAAPEPSAGILALAALTPLLLRRRRA